MKSEKIKVLGISAGDPAGIGPEVVLKALNSSKISANIFPLIIGNASLLSRYNDSLKSSKRIELLDDEAVAAIDFSSADNNTLYCYDPDKNAEFRAGEPSVKSGAYALLCIDTAVTLWKRRLIDAIVTAPVSKEYIQKTGIAFQGHTEYLAEQIGEAAPKMLMYSTKHSVILVTTHMPLDKVSAALSIDAVYETIVAADKAVRDIRGYTGRIGVCGIDPHCGDGGAIGDADMLITRKAVEKARQEGLNVEGPYASDTIFIPSRWSTYDIVVAHYHDQGLIPFKMVAFDTGVNVTLGLSLVRTSPDHGTAFDIAGKMSAEPGSMIEAINLAAMMVKRID